MTKGRIFKIKPGKKDAWQEWCEEIATLHKDEATKTLRQEQVLHELFVIFSIDGQDYTMGIMEPLPQATMQPADMDNNLNQKHLSKKQECLEPLNDTDVHIGYSIYNLE